jgi:diguanylate cyclase (GGDEF)-like protein
MSILIVDDAPADLDLLKSILTDSRRWKVRAAQSAEEALRVLASAEIQLVLTDIMSPATGGLEICRRIKAQPDFSHIPVVMVMAKSEREYLNQAYEAGACDYIMKPVDPAEVVARVRSVLRSKEEVDRRMARERELTSAAQKLEAANRQLQRLSVVDTVTGIANRRCFDQTLDRVWRSATRHKYEVALIMIDIDFFKNYNDSLGHPAGDDCLRRVAQALADALMRPDDFLARYGGEEFAVVLPQTGVPGALVVAERLRFCIESLGLAHPASSVARHVTISQGVASTVPVPAVPSSNLVSIADQALYEAKRSGRNRAATLDDVYHNELSGFAAKQSHNRTPGPGDLSALRFKPQ